MSRRRLLFPLITMVVLAVGTLVVVRVTDSRPTLGLDLQGGFSVVLQAKEVDGELPSEESVEKAKDIIRQRVDGLGVAEPDITRQGRTVIVQLPGVKNREKAEGLVGCTARLEFRPVLSQPVPNPNAPTTTGKDGKTSTTAKSSSTTTSGPKATSTTRPPSTTASEEDGTGMAGTGDGEGALPAQFAPTTTTAPTTTAPPTTAAPTTTTTAPASTTTAPGTPSTTAPPAESSGTSASACGTSGITSPDASTGVTLPPDAPEGSVIVPTDDGQALYTLGPVGFEGDALSSATAALNEASWVVNVDVKKGQRTKANELFNACYQGGPTCPGLSGADSSGRSSGAVAIVLDGQVISAPVVNGPDLASKQFTISGSFTQSSAKDLALVLRYGSLPVEFEQVALQQVSATLGADSLRAGLVAGLIGIAALALYMILYYRGFGLVVVASLLVWMSLMYGTICLLSASQGLAMTLAGITGVIVSVGTTVDTYVVVFERVKDEVREGRSLRSATEKGYASGIHTVYTANGAAFIGAFLLWYLTVGPVRGFAYFLGISVFLDLIVAVAFTRPLIILLGRSKRFARARFLGVGTATDQTNLVRGVPA